MRLALALLALTAGAARADLSPPFPLDGGYGGIAAGLLFAAAAATSRWATRTIQPGTASRATRAGITIVLVVVGIGLYLWGLGEARAERARWRARRVEEMNERMRREQQQPPTTPR